MCFAPITRVSVDSVKPSRVALLLLLTAFVYSMVLVIVL
jgi:hypothetical protein